MRSIPQGAIGPPDSAAASRASPPDDGSGIHGNNVLRRRWSFVTSGRRHGHGRQRQIGERRVFRQLGVARRPIGREVDLRAF